MRPVVYLLREAGPGDAYVQALEERGFQVVTIPVLAFTFVHEDVLRERLQAADAYGGLVLTSPRAVEALRRARDDGATLAPWRETPAFAVGPRTASEAAALGLTPVGQDSGSADALADVIVRHEPAKPLLFLAGNRRRDVLPEALAAAGVPFEELVVYETHAAGPLDLSGRPAPDWLVLFSPSGLEAVQQTPDLVLDAVRWAALGPTTAAALAAAGWPADAVAGAPTPEALTAALVAAH
jgi:uroporphyrinogen-III synthase